MEVEIGGKTECCKAFLICLTADLPAKSALLNMNQFNGDFSCIEWMAKGSNYRTEKGGNIHVFPYDATAATSSPAGFTGEGPTVYGPTRNSGSSVEDAQNAVTTGKPVHGIKGSSFLMFHDSFDYVRSSCVDYMHCVLQGMTKLLLGLWFSVNNAKELFSLSSCVDIVNKKLLYQTSPLFWKAFYTIL